MTDIATRARKLFEAISYPGQWKATPSEVQWGACYVEYKAHPHDEAREQQHADFITAAPDLVAGLLAALETAETERDRLRELARDTAKMFGEIEGSGELYYAPLHRQIDLLAEVAS